MQNQTFTRAYQLQQATVVLTEIIVYWWYLGYHQHCCRVNLTSKVVNFCTSYCFWFCCKRTNKSSSKDSKIISTVIGLVLSFVICWTPFQLRQTVYHVTVYMSYVTYDIHVSYTVFTAWETNLRLFLTFSNLNLSADLCLILSESSNVFVSLNCFLNPVIYGFLNTAYRQSIIRTDICDVWR